MATTSKTPTAPKSEPRYKANATPKELHNTPKIQKVSRPHRLRRKARRSLDETYIDWSEAVASLEHVDPELHAELLKDVVAEDRALDFSSCDSSQSSSWEHPLVDKRMRRRRMFLNSNAFQATPPFQQDSEESDLGVIDALNTEDKETAASPAPCPHFDCRLFPKIRYRVTRLFNEPQPEIYMHLLDKHSTTPFPCFEDGCTRVGKNGYFELSDLVHHVKQAHHGGEAMQRLKLRVKSELSDHKHGSSHDLASEKHGSVGDGHALKTVRKDQLTNIASWVATPVVENSPTALDTERPERTKVKSKEAYQAGQYPCPFRESLGCTKTFAWPPGAYRHAKSHGKDKPLVCPYPKCQKKFYHQSHLQSHMDIHNKAQAAESLAGTANSTPSPSDDVVEDGTGNSQLSPTQKGIYTITATPSHSEHNTLAPGSESKLANTPQPTSNSSNREKEALLMPEKEASHQSNTSPTHVADINAQGYLPRSPMTPKLDKTTQIEIPDSGDRSPPYPNHDVFQSYVSTEQASSDSYKDKCSRVIFISSTGHTQTSLDTSINESYMFSDEDDDYQGIVATEPAAKTVQAPSNQGISSSNPIDTSLESLQTSENMDIKSNNSADPSGDLSNQDVHRHVAVNEKQLNHSAPSKSSPHLESDIVLPAANNERTMTDTTPTLPLEKVQPTEDREAAKATIPSLSDRWNSQKHTPTLSEPFLEDPMLAALEAPVSSPIISHETPLTTKQTKRRFIEMEDSEDELAFNPRDKVLMSSRRTSTINSRGDSRGNGQK